MKQLIFTVLCVSVAFVGIGAVVKTGGEYFSINRNTIAQKVGFDPFGVKSEPEQQATVRMVQFSNRAEGPVDQDGQLKIVLTKPAESCGSTSFEHKTIILKRTSGGVFAREFKLRDADKDM